MPPAGKAIDQQLILVADSVCFCFLKEQSRDIYSCRIHRQKFTTDDNWTRQENTSKEGETNSSEDTLQNKE